MSAPDPNQAMIGIAPKLGKLLPRLASNHDGEVIATARAIGRTLHSAGFDFHDLAKAVGGGGSGKSGKGRKPPRHSAGQVDADLYRTALWCQGQHDRCSEKEVDFIASMVTMLSNGRQPSERQTKWLADIARRLRSEGAI